MKKVLSIFLFLALASPAFSSTDSLQAVKKWGKWLDRFDLHTGDNIVSLGAGNGWREFELSLLTNGLHFFLEDLDSVALNQQNIDKAKAEFAKGRKMALTNTFQKVYGTTTTIPVSDNLADKVMIMNAYHHFDNKDVMLKEIYRILKTHGHLIITDHVSLTESKESTYGCDRKYFMLNQRDLVDQIVRSNFKLVSVTPMAKRTRIFVFEKVEQAKITRTQGTSEYASISCGLADKKGNLWFGTHGEGVYCYNGNTFTQFTVENGLCNNYVSSILEDAGGNIWFGTAYGVCKFDGQHFINVPITVTGSGNYLSITIPSGRFAVDAYGVPDTENTVWSMMQDKKGTIWFGTTAGVYCYDGTSFAAFLNNKVANSENLQLKMIDDMLEDRNGNIWFCSGMRPGDEGIIRYDGQALTRFKPYGEGWVRKAMEDKNGNVYFATRHAGVVRYEKTAQGENFTNLTEKAGIDNGSVYTVFEDHSGNMWIGTELGSGEMGEDGGVWCYNGHAFTRLTTKEGLVHNGVSCIVEDKGGNLWFGTRNIGLCRYDGKTFMGFSE